MLIDKIRGFDGIRALAVLAVVATHLHILGALEHRGLLTKAMMPMLHGSTGVQAFFVLSGFLITTLLVQEMRATGTVSVKAFIIRRTLRIFPLYILFALAATALHVFGTKVTNWGSLAYAYLYSYNFVPRDLYTPFIGHTWSLAVEEHFYLIWPTVFLLLFPARPRLLAGLLAAFVAAAPITLFALNASGLGERYFVDRWSFVAGYSIAIGCLMALLFTNHRSGQKARAMVGHPGTGVIGIVLFANSLLLGTDPFGMDEMGGSGYLRAFGIALLIGWVYCNQASLVVRALEVTPLRYLGMISYGVYMYQGLFLSTGGWRAPGSTWPPSQNIGFLLLVVAAPLSFHFFERPFLRLKGRLGTPEAAKPAPIPANYLGRESRT